MFSSINCMPPGGSAPSLFEWQQYAYFYNARLDGDGASAYHKCWFRFLKEINPRFKTYEEREEVIHWEDLHP